MTRGVSADGIEAVPGLPTGGSSGQVLQKSSATDYDVAWGTVAAAAHTHTLADITDDGALAALNTVGTSQIDDAAVTLAKMANIATDRLIGRDTAGTGVPEALTVGGGIEFTGAGGIQTSALTGDVTKSAGGTATTIANDAVTYAKMQNVSATDRVLGRSSSGSGDVEEITCTAAGRALIDDADASAQRTTLGLGTAATQNTGTSGANVPLLNGSNVWASPQEITNTGAAAVLIFRRPQVHGEISALGSFSGRGQDDAGNSETYVQAVMYCTQDANGTEQGLFNIQTLNSGVSQGSFSVGAGGQFGAPTGGDKGYGTVNATAVYDDNTLLTCYVFDAHLDGGAVDLKKWDDLTPNVDYVDIVTKQRVFQERTHEPLRKFASRLGGPEDPLDLDKYINHWKTKRHLTSMPNEANFDPVRGLPAGAWIQRLVETVEIQAVHISQLNDRIKALEAANK